MLGTDLSIWSPTFQKETVIQIFLCYMDRKCAFEKVNVETVGYGMFDSKQR